MKHTTHLASSMAIRTAPSFTVTLMHPTLIAQPFHHKGWVYEEKVDGYRMVAHKDEGAVGIISRQGKDHTSQFPDLVKALASLSARSFILDGEVAVYGDDVKGDTDPVRTQVPGALAYNPSGVMPEGSWRARLLELAQAMPEGQKLDLGGGGQHPRVRLP